MNKLNRKEGVANLVTTILLVITFILSVSSFSRIQTLNIRVGDLEVQLQEQQERDANILDNLKGIRKDQENLLKINQERLELERKRFTSVSNLKSAGFSRNTDLASNTDLSVDDMNKIIDDWDNHVSNGTRFKGKGAVFVKASKETGLNPVYILAHAAWESTWGNSYIARTKNNFYGINCIDSNPDEGYVMGNNLDEGVIAGAKWIKVNYYNNGYTTLQSMLDAGYASDTGNWAKQIANIANSSVRVL